MYASHWRMSVDRSTELLLSDRQAKRQVLLDAVEHVRAGGRGRYRARRSANGTLPGVVVEAMQEAGLFRLKMPAELGGADADPVTQMEVIEAMAAIYPSAGWVLMTNATAIGNAGAFLPDETVAEVFAGGRVPRAATVGRQSAARSCRPTADSSSTAGGRSAAACRTRSGSAWARGSTGRRMRQPDFYTCFVPHSVVTIHDNWHVAGLKGSGSNDVSVEDLFVPARFTWPRSSRSARRAAARRTDLPARPAGLRLERARGVRAGRRTAGAGLDQGRRRLRSAAAAAPRRRRW